MSCSNLFLKQFLQMINYTWRLHVRCYAMLKANFSHFLDMCVCVCVCVQVCLFTSAREYVALKRDVRLPRIKEKKLFHSEYKGSSNTIAENSEKFMRHGRESSETWDTHTYIWWASGCPWDARFNSKYMFFVTFLFLLPCGVYKEFLYCLKIFFLSFLWMQK